MHLTYTIPRIASSVPSAAICITALVTPVYIPNVVEISLCPRNSCTTRGLTPCSSIIVAKVWRNWWKVTLPRCSSWHRQHLQYSSHCRGWLACTSSSCLGFLPQFLFYNLVILFCMFSFFFKSCKCEAYRPPDGMPIVWAYMAETKCACLNESFRH